MNGPLTSRYLGELKRIIDELPDPNEGRIKELRDMIHNGRFQDRDVIRETAEQIAKVFLGEALNGL